MKKTLKKTPKKALKVTKDDKKPVVVTVEVDTQPGPLSFAFWAFLGAAAAWVILSLTQQAH